MQGGMDESSRPGHLLPALQSTPVKSGCEQLSVCRNPVTEHSLKNKTSEKKMKGLEVE